MNLLSFENIGLPVGDKQREIVKKEVFTYKYNSPDLSLIEGLVLDPFWNKFVYVYPEWLAPNLITAMGGSCVLMATVLILWGASEGVEAIPSWVFFASAALLFAYQTLDGTDGKQARRTKSGSALGHLFDHGVDSVCGTLITSWASFLSGLGFGHPVIVVVLLLYMIAFFLSNSTNLHRGRQKFFSLDVMEVQCGVMAILVATGYLGVDTWYQTVFDTPWAPITIQHFVAVIVVSAMVGNGFAYYTACYEVYSLPESERPPPREGRGPKSASIQCRTCIMFSVLAGINWAILHFTCPHKTYQSVTNPLRIPLPPLMELLPWYSTMVGGYAGLVIHLLMTTVAALPFPKVHWSILTQIAFLFTHFCPGSAAGWVVAFITAFCLFNFFTTLMLSIRDALGIKIFTIKPKTQ